MSGLTRRAPRPEADTAFLASVLEGLSQPQKRLESKFLYDAEGSRLFDRICALDEYYPTRVEIGILRARAAELAHMLPPRVALVEIGSGSSTKTRLLLDALPAIATYLPVDISAEPRGAAAERLQIDYPRLAIAPIVADFTLPIPLPQALNALPKLLFFPGSTIGNFALPQARALLGQLGRLPGAAALVVGADLRKDVKRLIRAYDDTEGVTAAFNKNLLVRINRTLDGSFDIEQFRHQARWNEAQSRIEMHLVSARPQVVQVAGRRFSFATGETIHTENSYKFSLQGFGDLAASAGWTSADVWCDAAELFSVHVLARPDGGPAAG